MSDFRTTVSIQPSLNKITLKTPVLTVGSCFADAIGARLRLYKVPASINPYGVTYNPVSIHKILTASVLDQQPDPVGFITQQQISLHFDFHSEHADTDQKKLGDRLNDLVHDQHQFLKDADWILITYGTAWVYTRIETNEIVANCHKVPAREFAKSLLTEKMILDSFGAFHQELKKYNPKARVILTVSPVRHLKDTMELNSVSKSVLRVACHAIGRKFFDVEYFPAFEMMMDDLRDYRFYKSDMLHPTEAAEDYIWQKFAERYIDAETQKFISRWDSILNALSHKPFHPTSDAHQQFLKQTLEKLEELKSMVNVDKEMNDIRSQIESKS